MAQPFQNVQPGDLITSDQMNRILAALNDLDGRVTALQGSAVVGDAVVITDMIPPSGIIKVGDELTLIGRNFGFSTGAQRVYIDDTRVDAYQPGSSDSQLVFDIPLTITNVPQAGRSAVLTVSNASSTTQRTLLLQSAAVLTGAADVIFQNVNPATIAAAAPVTFTFTLRSRANLDAVYAVSATVNVAANQAAWQSNVQIQNADSSPMQSNQISVPAGQTKTLLVSINPVPPGTNGVAFSLTVNAAAGTVNGTSGPVAQTVGSPADIPDPTLTLGFSSGTAPGGSINSSQVSIPAAGSAKVSLNATFTLVGSYNLTGPLSGGATNWTVVALASSTPNPFPIAQGDLGQGGTAAKTLDFVVTRGAGATSGQITFTVQRSGATQSRKFTMTVNAI